MISQQTDGNNALSLRVVNLSYPEYGFLTIVVPNETMYTVLDETIPVEDLPEPEVKYDDDGNVISEFEYHGGNIGDQASKILSVQQRAAQALRQKRYDEALERADGDKRRIVWSGDEALLISVEQADENDRKRNELYAALAKQAEEAKPAKRKKLKASDGKTVTISSPSPSGYTFSYPTITLEELKVAVPIPYGKVSSAREEKTEEEEEDKELEPE